MSVHTNVGTLKHCNNLSRSAGLFGYVLLERNLRGSEFLFFLRFEWRDLHNARELVRFALTTVR